MDHFELGVSVDNSAIGPRSECGNGEVLNGGDEEAKRVRVQRALDELPEARMVVALVEKEG